MSAVLEARDPSARHTEAVQPSLVRQFDLVATAPGGVARLRELILSLAVRGKLVQQDPRDEPASELLRQIRAERAALAAAGQIKHDKPVTPISSDEEPCALPSGWAWVRFGDLIHELCTGPFGSLIHKEDYVSGGVPLVNPSHMIGGRIRHDPDVSVSTLVASHLAAYRLSVGDVLLARRGEMGRYALVTEREAGWLCGTGSFFLKLSKSYDRKFFGLTLEDPRLRRHLLGESVGATMTNLNQRILLDAVVAVAPLAEQARIVARVDELMRLCDALEANGRLEAEQHARLLDALLGSLTSSSSPEQLAINWKRVADHFDLLLDRHEAVDALEETVLRLAVRGLLVPQYEAESKGKKPSNVKSEELSDPPFRIPASWSWVTLADMCTVRGGATPSKSIAEYWTGDIPWVSPKDMKVSVISDAQDHVSAAALKGPLSLIPAGSLLLVVRGMILARSFPVAQTNVSVTINQDMKALTPRDPELLPFLLLACQAMRQEILKLVERSTHGTCKLESPKIFGLPFPVPPLREQQRIVAHVDRLRQFCANLREKLTAGRALQERLAEALLEEAVQSKA